MISRRHLAAVVAAAALSTPVQAFPGLPLLFAVFPALQTIFGLFGGTVSLSAAIAGVSVEQWLQIAQAVLKAAPEEIRLVEGLHQVFARLIAAVLRRRQPHDGLVAVNAWLAANGQAAIKLQPGISTER